MREKERGEASPGKTFHRTTSLSLYIYTDWLSFRPPPFARLRIDDGSVAYCRCSPSEIMARRFATVARISRNQRKEPWSRHRETCEWTARFWLGKTVPDSRLCSRPMLWRAITGWKSYCSRKQFSLLRGVF